MSERDGFGHRLAIPLSECASKAAKALSDDWDDNGCSSCGKLPDGPDHVAICVPTHGWRGTVICQQCAAAAKAALRDRGGSNSTERPPVLEYWRKGSPPADGCLYIVETSSGSIHAVQASVVGGSGMLWIYRPPSGRGGAGYLTPGDIAQHLPIAAPPYIGRSLPPGEEGGAS